MTIASDEVENARRAPAVTMTIAGSTFAGTARIVIHKKRTRQRAVSRRTSAWPR
ncbi:MAG: hypothetical protein NZ699_16340 [Roseiflexus sp.]|nr:hypothetical protein [Roseiflexus sp.]MCS7290692.1 hypothetical protein [Roseiflexus sp.]MDW8145423.1 hypothetical protein [Roseiflexaceae bacterium]MDW8232238.1 hypothetical protein [Roseiflexaceae bacterium]